MKYINSLKYSVLVLAVLLLLFFLIVFPVIALDLSGHHAMGGFIAFFWIFLGLIMMLGLEAILFLALKVIQAIKVGTIDRVENVRRLKTMGIIGFSVTGIFLVANLIYLFIGISHPGIFLFSLFLFAIGETLSLGAIVLGTQLEKRI